MINGRNGVDELEALLPYTVETNVERMATYSDDDDAVTESVGALIAEQKWIVQLTPLDRRLMSTEELFALWKDERIDAGTLVWRGGMSDWLPLGRIDALSAPPAQPTLPPRHWVAPAPRPGTMLRAVLFSSAVALLGILTTTYGLALGGVFDGLPSSKERSAATGAPAQPTTASAEPLGKRTTN